MCAILSEDILSVPLTDFSVFEYVPDSEEASQSQTESIISSGSQAGDRPRDVSDGELEFLERTSAFIASMQKLRQEIRDEEVRFHTIAKSFKNEKMRPLCDGLYVS